MICLTLTENTLEKNRRLVEQYADAIDCLELRADFLDEENDAALRSFLEALNCPCIYTLRRKQDGGRSLITTDVLKKRLLQVSELPFTYMDIEEEIDDPEFLKLIRGKAALIRSFHDFKGIPVDLETRMAGILEEGDIPKAAVFPQTTEQLRSLFKTAENLRGRFPEKAGHWILLGMGEIGFPTRILTPWTGSLLTYCSAEGKSAAPGHVSPRLLQKVYRYTRLNRNFRLFGIIGNPVLHSRSPEIHNRWLDEAKIDGIYLPFPTDDPAAFLQLANDLGIEGFSVTIPYKQKIIPLLDTPDESVKAIGACNTVYRRQELWKGTNSDYLGFMAPLEEIPAGKAVVLGAGGAARGVIYGLLKKGWKVTTLNRTLSRAKALAEEFGCLFGPLRPENMAGADLIVQTTSAGMEPHEERNPAEGFDFADTQWAYDIIYCPEETRFLKMAKARGCKTINGIQMLREQAHVQFRLFTR